MENAIQPIIEKSKKRKKKENTPFYLVRKNYRSLIRFLVSYRLLCLFIFFPLLIYAERLMLVVNGTSNLAAYNVKGFLLNPLIWILAILIFILVILFAEVEQFGIISLLHASYSHKKLKANEAYSNSIDMVVHTLKPQNFLMLFYFLLVFPTTQAFDNSNIIRFITIPGFILEHFTKYPLLGFLYNFVGLVLFYIGFRLIYCFIVLTIEKCNFKEACISSYKMTKGKKGLHLYFSIIMWHLWIFILFLILFVLVIILLIAIIYWLDPSVDFAPYVTPDNLFLIFTIFTMVYNWFTSPITQAIVMSSYYRIKAEEGVQVPSFEYDRQLIKKRPIFITVSIICLVIMFFSIPARYQQFKWILRGDSSNVMIMAHRGFSSAAPENTIPAFQAAVDCGAKAVELDVQMLKDGTIIVLHDDNLKRTTGFDKNVWEVTYDEIKYLDNGSFFSPEFANTRIPTLDEVIRYFNGKLYINIEIKRTGHDEGIEDKVVEIIRNNHFQDQCDVTSQDYDTLKYIYERYPDILLAYTSVVGIGDIQNLEAMDIISIQETFANYETVEAMHRAGKRVFVWTVNESATMDRLISLGVDAILTNDPVLGQEVLAQHQGPMDHYKRLQQLLFYLN